MSTPIIIENMDFLHYLKWHHTPKTLYTEDGIHFYSMHDFVRVSEHNLDEYMIDKVIDDKEGEIVYVKH